MTTKAKWKRYSVGSICKSQDAAKPDYLKLRGGETAKKLASVLANANDKKGVTLALESKKQQLASLERNVEAGKINGDFAETVRSRIEKIPDYVRFEVVLIEKE
jgi:hypothetical protein